MTQSVLVKELSVCESSFWASLDFIRWSAAMLVVVAHARHLLFVDYYLLVYKDPTFLHSISNKLFYFITGLGHEAVVLFFVLSGYLVGGAYSD